jgi:hypothetical protein
MAVEAALVEKHLLSTSGAAGEDLQLRRCLVTVKADEKYCDCDERQSDSLVHIGLNEARRVPQLVLGF